MGRKDFLLRLEEELHADVAKAAAADGLSVSEWLRRAAEEKLAGAHKPSSAGIKDALRLLADTAARLGDGFVLVPGAEAPGSAWDRLMSPDSKKSELGV